MALHPRRQRDRELLMRKIGWSLRGNHFGKLDAFAATAPLNLVAKYR